MKTITFPILVLVSALLFSCSRKTENLSSTRFKVWGNCEMCKKTIEKAANKVDGVEEANWDKDIKEISIFYDSLLTSPGQIQVAIADAGYDTESRTGNNSAYEHLPHCCQYERKEIK